MFRAPLCPSSEAPEYYTGGCCLWYLMLWFSSCRYGVELRVMCPVCGLQPETCWASNKICNKNHLLHLVGILFPHIKTKNINFLYVGVLARTISEHLAFTVHLLYEWCLLKYMPYWRMFPMKLLLIRPSFYVTTVSQSMAKCLMGYMIYAGMRMFATNVCEHHKN